MSRVTKLEDYDIDSKKAFETAKEKSLVVVIPGLRELQIDIDDEKQYFDFKRRYQIAWDSGEVAGIISDKPSFTNGHRHIIVTVFEDLTPLRRIFLQLYLGSDPTREFLSYRRIMIDDPTPTLFLEKP